MRNEDLYAGLEYFSEEYDEEREMEPRPTRVREAIPIPQAASSWVRRQREKVIEIEDAPNKEGSKATHEPSSLGSGGSASLGGPPTYYPYRGYASQAPSRSGITVSHRIVHPSGVFPNSYPFNAQPMYPLPNAHIYPNQAPSGLFADYTGCVTPFVRWIKDYLLPDGLKMPSHIGSYDRKGDTNNFLHLFKGAIRMKKWAMAVAYHMKSFDPILASRRSLRRHITQYIASSRRKEKALELSLLEKKQYPEEEFNRRVYSWTGKIVVPPVLRNDNSSDPVIIKVKISGRQVNRVYMDSESSCEVIYEQCFLHLKPSIRSLRVDSKVPLVGFSGEHSWPLGKVPLEITIGCMSAEEEIVINDKYPDQAVIIGRQLPTGFKKRLQDFLKANADIFTWTYADMTEISRTIMVEGKPFITKHKLNELKHMEPRKQKKRGLAPERSKALQKEVEELTKANILQEVKYQTWVQGFENIAKAVAANEWYEVVEVAVHVDDMVIKSDSKEDMLSDIQETFDKLWAINMKLNPILCSFGLEEGPFLGYHITKQGIKANPSKVKAISDLKPPKTVKEIQSLNEKLAALSQFLSKGIDKTLL
ncbi:hypothetical protein Tco_1353835 [Tanacetum coccineum]